LPLPDNARARARVDGCFSRIYFGEPGTATRDILIERVHEKYIQLTAMWKKQQKHDKLHARTG
jgi:hypothetical protein